MDAAIFDHLDRARRIAEREYQEQRTKAAWILLMSIERALHDARMYQECKHG